MYVYPFVLFLKEFFKRCKHERVRCIHGDEINSTGRAWRHPSIARVRCLDCGRALYKMEMPEICSNTGTPHNPRMWRHRNG